MTRPATMPVLSPAATVALAKLAGHAQKYALTLNGEQRASLALRIKRALEAVPPKEAALLRLMVLKHRSVADIAAASGVSVDALIDLRSEAAASLARHYEREGADDGRGEA